MKQWPATGVLPARFLGDFLSSIISDRRAVDTSGAHVTGAECNPRGLNDPPHMVPHPRHLNASILLLYN